MRRKKATRETKVKSVPLSKANRFICPGCDRSLDVVSYYPASREVECPNCSKRWNPFTRKIRIAD